ncbi:MAG: hypothetical protein GWP59_02255 [Chlamydiales bacterium]|nr:hypothetical protein [Chlamydiales bacterium]NCF70503.1 hypothetical protein [Chlamydiales bacterium]
MLNNLSEESIQGILDDLAQSQEAFAKTSEEKRKRLIEQSAKYNSLELLSFCAEFWGYDHPEHYLLIPYALHLISQGAKHDSLEVLDLNSGHSWLKELKELFLRESSYHLTLKQGRLKKKELHLFFESLFSSSTQPFGQSFEEKLKAIFSEGDKDKYKNALKEFSIQIDAVKKRLRENKEAGPLKASTFEVSFDNDQVQQLAEKLCFDLDIKPDDKNSLNLFTKHSGKLYCFCPQMLSESFLSLYFAMEGKSKQKGFIQDKVEEGLATLFSSEYIFSRVKLGDTHPKSTASDIPCDLLVIYDNVLLCFAFQSPDKEDQLYPVGSEAASSILEAQVQSPTKQARKVLNFVSQVKHFSIKDQHNEVLQVFDASSLDRGYFICINSEAMGGFLPRMRFADTLSLCGREDPFWHCSIHDFNYLLSHFDSATEFILFIERRLAAEFRINPFDEVCEAAYLANYKDNQLLQLQQDKFSEYIDFFIRTDWKGKLQEEFSENIEQLDKQYNHLVASVEQSKQKGSFEVTSFLINLPSNYKRRLMKMFNIERESFLKDGKGHGFSRYFKELASGVTLFCANRETLDSFWGKMYQYVNNKVMQADCKQWMLITEVYQSGKQVGYDFRIYKGLQKEHHSDLGF